MTVEWKVCLLLIRIFSGDANKKEEWNGSERVYDREEEGGHIAAMLQCGVGLLAAGFEEEAAGFFVDCFEIVAGL